MPFVLVGLCAKTSLNASKMLCFNTTKLFHLLKHTRNASGSLVSKEIKKKPIVKVLDIKQKPTKKKPRKKHIIVKRVSDDIEEIWLENLTSLNLDLYRKTSYGSYRKINLDKLLEKLKEIYPTTLGNVDATLEKTSAEDVIQPLLVQKKNQTEKSQLSSKTSPENVEASPYLSDYLIKHIMDFPMLKNKCTSSFSDFIKEESEEFGTVDVVTFPSVSTILNETMSQLCRIKLKKWRENMIAELGAEGFSKFNQDTMSEGTIFHSTLKTYLEVSDKRLVTVNPRIEGCWRSIEKTLLDISDVRFIEESVYHPVLMYKGILDCVAAYRGTPCVIEWKKSAKQKLDLSSTYDAPLQLSAYLGALPWHKNVTVSNGLVVVAYTDGSPANVFEMSVESCEVYWLEWLRRLQKYWLKRSSTIIQQEN